MDTLLITILPSVMILGYLFIMISSRNQQIYLTVFLGFLICLPAGILNEFSENQFLLGQTYQKDLYIVF